MRRVKNSRPLDFKDKITMQETKGRLEINIDLMVMVVVPRVFKLDINNKISNNHLEQTEHREDCKEVLNWRKITAIMRI